MGAAGGAVVAVGGLRVAVGGSEVAVGGTGVSVEETGAAVAAGDPHAATSMNTITPTASLDRAFLVIAYSF